MNVRWILGSLFALAFSTALTRAHTAWIEPSNASLVIRFAEPGNDFETSPGYLDSLSPPLVFTVVTNFPKSIQCAKKSDHFSLASVSPTNQVCVETIFTVRGGRKPYFYARWQPAGATAGKPMLTFDLVPTGKPGEARVYFRGQPLGGLTATLRNPTGKEQKVTADTAGLFRFSATEPGQYLLTIPHYRESVGGYHLGVAYTETSHNTALSWVQY